jgi:hypothetical protein
MGSTTLIKRLGDAAGAGPGNGDRTLKRILASESLL